MTKKAKKLSPGEEKVKDKKQELFCQLYAGLSTRDFFGNATNSYLYAYGGQDEIDKIETDLIIAGPNSDLDAIGIADKRRKNARIFQLKSNAKTSGNRLLRIVHILKRVNYLTDQFLNDDMMDREMAYVIAQRNDLMSKVTAYDKVTKIKNRITDKLTGELVVRWEDDDEDEELEEKQKKKPIIKAKIAIKKDDPIQIIPKRKIDQEVEFSDEDEEEEDD